MARQSNRRAAPSRSVPVKTAPAPPPAPVQHAQPQQPGLMAQMASTAAGVAVGSSVGHVIGAGITGMFGGGSQPQTVAPPQQQQQIQPVSACEADQKAFLRCLDANPSNINACQFYLDMYKQCQSSEKSF